MNSLPFLSVVVLNYNAGKYIVACLKSILESSYKNLEIILVDNQSLDGSIETLKSSLTARELAGIRIIINKTNLGAAIALNQGARIATGKYITFVATDTLVDKDCFLHLVESFEDDPSVGGASSKLLMMHKPDAFDSAGEYLSQYGILIQRHAGQEIDRGQFNQKDEIFSAKGTALTVRAEAFKSIGMFPEDYFMFLEETDLCWRIWLVGYRIIFVPDALIFHARGASVNASTNRNYLVKYFGTRNYIMTLIKNFGFMRFMTIVPVNILMWFGLSIFLIIRGRIKEGWFVMRGILWNIFNLNKILEGRAKVQKLRRIPDSLFLGRVLKHIPLSYLFNLTKGW